MGQGGSGKVAGRIKRAGARDRSGRGDGGRIVCPADDGRRDACPTDDPDGPAPAVRQHRACRVSGAGAASDAYDIVNTNPNLANCNTSTNSKSLCQAPSTRPGTSSLKRMAAMAPSRCGICSTILSHRSAPPTDRSFHSKCKSWGIPRFPGYYAYQSAVANLAPVNGFL